MTLEIEKLKKILIEVLLFLNVFLFYLAIILKGNEIIKVKTLYLVYCIGCSLVILISTYTQKELIYIYILNLLYFIKILVSKESNLLILILSLLAFKDYSLKKIMKRLLIYSIIFFCIVVFYQAIFGNFNIYIRGNQDIRYDLGFGNPNILAKILSTIFALIILQNNKIKITSSVGIIIVYSITKSRTIAVFFIILIFGDIFYKKMIKNRIFKFITINFYSILYLISVFFSLNYSNNIYINKLMSNRPIFFKYFLTNYSPKILGQNLEMKDTYFNALDNSYINHYLEVGILFSIIIMILYRRFILGLIKNNQKEVFLITISILITGLFENNLNYINTNFILIFVITTLKNKKVRGNKNENNFFYEKYEKIWWLRESNSSKSKLF